ncbi:MAG: type III-A CRISPR-associated RAMP protein Csm3 [Chloroflexi bacterium]|nr:MAG: type III-A CRISPR-associated RAMP protein Csm3 [Chloroflexota bacterium]
MTKIANLYGRVFIKCEIETKTGLHIGGAESSLSIGGVDNVIIRDPLSNRPYIPGSSLKGKMRSQMEKFHGLPQNRRIGQVTIHTCQNGGDYANCVVCHIYGLPGDSDFSTSTRLVVRDVQLTKKSVKKLGSAKTDLPFSEVKWEAAIDRVTSAATLRQMERVPAGAVFGPVELVYSIYEQADVARFENVVEGMQLLEDDYLGGSGSRGSGKVAFRSIKLTAKSRANYRQGQDYERTFDTLDDLAAALPAVMEWIEKDGVPVPVKEG